MAPTRLAHPRTIPGVLENAALTVPETPALVTETVSIGYRQLFEGARSVAAALVTAGVRPLDQVGIRLANSPEWAVAAYGILCAGARVVPVNVRYSEREAVDVIRRSRCALVVTDDRALPGAVAFEELIGTTEARDEVDRRLRALDPDDIAYLQYTSGSTGRPKGVMLRHGGLVDSTRSWVEIVGLRPQDRYAVVAPFAHIGGHKTGLLACAIAAATALPRRALEAPELARAVGEHGITFLQGPPALFTRLMAEPAMPVGRIRVAVTGAAVVPRELVVALRERLGVPEVFTAYGLTEAGGVCTMTRRSDPAEAVAGTAGRAIPGMEVRIATKDPVHPEGPGEILVRGPGLMAGYLDDPAGTEEAFAGGWLRTGDIGELDDSGRLRVVDRLKDMVIVGGLNVSPAEVERVLLDHDRVTAAAVVGIPHAELGEVPAAFVVGDASAADLVHHCERGLAGFKVPRTIRSVAELPINAAGKVDKPRLRREALA